MTRLLLLAMLGLALGVAAALSLQGSLGPFAPPRPLSTGTALIGGPFRLVDHTGKQVTDQDFRGRHMLVYFGFTHCPDVCPTGLNTMTVALNALGQKAERITPLFITLDPERDTPELLAQYVKSFHPRFVGLTGTPENVAQVVKAYKVAAKKVPSEPPGSGYTFDHSSVIYWMDENGQFVAPFTHGSTPEQITARLNEGL